MPSSSTATQAQPAAPLTAMTTWERHEAGFPPRGADERARYAALDQCSARPEAEMEAGQ